jgi:DNA polymerase-3 subunit alpha
MIEYGTLHSHCYFSAMDGLNSPEDMVKKAKELDLSFIAITDHGQYGAFLKTQKAGEKEGIKTILGVEGYVVDRLELYDEKEKRIREKNNHVILLASNEKGYKSLLKLNYISNIDAQHFYYKPRFTFEELFENNEGLVVGSACIASGFAGRLKSGNVEGAEELFLKFLSVFKDRFYGEVQLNEITKEYGLSQKEYNDWLIEICNKTGVPIVLTDDAHYAEPEGAATQKFCFNLRKKEDAEADFFVCNKLYLHTIDDYLKLNKEFDFNYKDEDIIRWCNNTKIIGDKCNFNIPPKEVISLPEPFPEIEDEDEYLFKLVREGMMDWFKVKKYGEIPEEYRNQIKEELNLFRKKGLSRYILILYDIMNFVHKEKYMFGISRGSCGGSLSLAAINIIGRKMDAIKNGLLFSRFLSEERLPSMIINYKAED